MTDWQLIETAPKPKNDSTPIIVFRASRHASENIFLAEWDSYQEVWRIHIDGQRIEPTHWMPLPDPPRPLPDNQS